METPKKGRGEIQGLGSILDKIIQKEAPKRGITVRKLSWAKADKLKGKARLADKAQLEKARKEGNLKEVQEEIQRKNSIAQGPMEILDWRPIHERK